MRKLAVGITEGVLALTLAGILAWNAEAMTLTGAKTVHPASLVEKVGCWLPDCRVSAR